MKGENMKDIHIRKAFIISCIDSNKNFPHYSANSVDGGLGKGLSGAGGVRGGPGGVGPGGDPRGGSPSPGENADKHLTEAELQVRFRRFYLRWIKCFILRTLQWRKIDKIGKANVITCSKSK